MDNFVTPLEEPEVVDEIPLELPLSQTGDVALDTLKILVSSVAYYQKHFNRGHTMLYRFNQRCNNYNWF